MVTLSIIVPVYNVKEYLSACVESICGQTFRDWELILVDDGAQDGSGQLCEALAHTDPRIRVIHQENGGVSKARNTGIRAAVGKYLAFVDGDDFIHPRMYEMMIGPMEQGCDITFCRFSRYYPDRTIIHVEHKLQTMADAPWDYRCIIYESEQSYRSLADRVETDTVFGSAWRSLFRGDLIRTKGLRFPEGIRIAEDRLFLMEYLSWCRRGHLVDDYLYYYRAERQDSATALGTSGYQPELYARKKELLLRETALIRGNAMLPAAVRKNLIAYERYRLALDVVLNELLHCPDCREKLKNLFKDELLKKAIDCFSFIHMMKTGVPAKRMILYGMIRLRCWNLLSKMLYRRRRQK